MNDKLLELTISKLESIKLPNPNSSINKKRIYSTSARNAGRQSISNKPDITSELINELKSINEIKNSKFNLYTIICPSIYVSNSIMKYLKLSMKFMCKDDQSELIFISWVNKKRLDKFTDSELSYLVDKLIQFIEVNPWILKRSNWIKPKIYESESLNQIINKFIKLILYN